MADLADHLERLFIRLGPRVGVVDPVKPRHLGDQHFRELGARNGAKRAAEETHLGHGIGNRLAHAFAAIANIDGPDAARHGIDMFLALDVPDAQPAAFDDDARVDGFIGLVLADMVPDMGAISLDHMAGVVGKIQGIHVRRLRYEERFGWPANPVRRLVHCNPL